MAALMEKISFRYVRGDEDFTKTESYQVCGFVLEIGVKTITDYEFGTVVWGAALALCQYFENQGMEFAHRKVIELGAGTGILSILTVLLGGDVTITDKPQLLKLIERNVSLNVSSSCRPRVKIRALSWGYDHTLFPSDYDFILAADIMLFHENVPLILKTLLHLSNERTVIYFASTMSICAGPISLGYLILSQHFDSELLCRYESKDINVYRMTKKPRNVGYHLVP